MLEMAEETYGLSRRQLLQGLVALGLIPSVALSCGADDLDDFLDKIRNRPERRNVTSLSNSDDIIVAYRDAVTQMQALPASDKRSWEHQASIHNNFCPHRNWLFLPWHRHYLYWFELIVRDLSGMDDWALPYWNWLEDGNIPAAFQSGVLDHPRNRQSVSISATIADTAMGFMSFTNFGSGSLGPGDPQRTFSTASTFESQIHNPAHGQIGQDMGSFFSPRDPIFWLHHNMIEYMWVEWNLCRGNQNPSDDHWFNFEFSNNFVNGTGADVNGGTSAVWFGSLLPLLAYQFETSRVGTVDGTC